MVVVEGVNAQDGLDHSPKSVPDSCNESTTDSHLHPAAAVSSAPRYEVKQCFEEWWIPGKPRTVDPPAESIPLESLSGLANSTSVDTKLLGHHSVTSSEDEPLILLDLYTGTWDNGEIPVYPFVEPSSIKNYRTILTLKLGKS
jgi:hypothetical protein